jgi:hypothetical protein
MKASMPSLARLAFTQTFRPRTRKVSGFAVD